MDLLRTTRLRRLAIVAIVAIAGCSTPGNSGPPASPRVSCVGIPASKCDEAVASVARSLPNSAPVSIEVSCVSGTCTTESGAMDTVVTLADGSQLRSTTLTWSAPGTGSGGGGAVPGGVIGPLPLTPAPMPAPAIPVEPTCQGVPVSMCRTMAETAFGELDDQAVIAILIRCTEPPCTDRHGTGDTVVSYADGTTRSSSWEYAGG